MSHRSGVALINLTEIMNSGWRRLAHWCFVKKRVLTPGRIDQMLVIISMRLKIDQVMLRASIDLFGQDCIQDIISMRLKLG